LSRGQTGGPASTPTTAPASWLDENCKRTKRHPGGAPRVSACGIVTPVALDLTIAAWAALELALRVTERLQGRGRAARDRGTRVVIALTLGTAIGFAVASASHPSAPRLPAVVRVAGLLVLWLGLAVRVWAVATLGRAFRTTVEVEPEQTVVTGGPYRWVRHPSYSGLLLIALGAGLAAGTWPAVAVCAVLPLPGLVLRIRVEEAELVRVLGNRYRRYRAGTKRLVPRVW